MNTAADLTNFELIGVIGEFLNFLSVKHPSDCVEGKIYFIRGHFFCKYLWSSITRREFKFWLIQLISPFLYGDMRTCLINLFFEEKIYSHESNILPYW